MKKRIKFLKLLMAIFLFLTVPITDLASTPAIAIAATAAPKAATNKITLYKGYKTYQLKFKNLKKNAIISFSSSDNDIAKVSKNGIVTPVSEGDTFIAALIKQNNKTYNIIVYVTVAVSNVKFTSKTGTLTAGAEFTFKAKAYGTASKITWSLSNQSVAKIDSKTGKLTALSKGETDVIATAGYISCRCTVVINNGRFTTESKDIVCYNQKLIWITVDDYIKNEDIKFNIDDDTIIDCVWGDFEGDKVPLLIKPKETGSTTITISSSKTSDTLLINVTVVETPNSRDKNAKELNAKEIYEKCSPATVEIQVTTNSGEAIGSGFFILSGVIVTNYHVIEDATKITVVTNKNKTYEVKEIWGYDETYDIAILEIDAVTESLDFNLGDITVGETVYALGSPRGLTGSLSDGIVSSDSRIMDGVDYVQITAPISPGNSGGPLINAYGEVIGINTFILLDSQNLNFAVNIYQINKLNLNSSITAEAFYKANKEKAPEAVYEDKTKSGEIETSQEVPAGIILNGSLEASDYVDFYHIKLTEAGHIFGLLAILSDTNYDSICFRLIDKDVKYMCNSQTYTTNDNVVYHCIDADLPAGDYYIAVFRSDKNTTDSMKYSFIYNIK